MSTPFFGRVEERTTMAAARLVVIHGPGGAGKTRLALEGDPAIVVRCDGVQSLDELRERFAGALGAGDPRRALSARSMRLVADEVDHLAPDALAWLASFDVPVVCTARMPLELEGAIRIAVSGLDAAAALALFTSLAGVHEHAQEIVDRVDRLPLAIELAASRATLLGSSRLLARLDRQLETFPALRAALAESWALLDAREQETLVIAARFAGEMDAELLEAAGGDLDSLGRLRDALLIHAAPGSRPRFRLAEAIRGFAREHGGEDPRFRQAIENRARPLADAARRGVDVWEELAPQKADLLAMGAIELAVPLLSPSEIVRLTSPCDTARLLVDRAEALRSLGRHEEARAALAAAQSSDPEIEADRARALAAIERTVGRSDAALAILVEARKSVPPSREGLLLDAVGSVLQTAGRLAEARERHAEAVALHVANGARHAEALARSHLAVATHRLGDAARAVPLHEEALAMHRDLRLAGAELLHIAFCKHELGESSFEIFARAKSKLAEAGATALEAMAAILEARLAVDENDVVRASLHLAEARRLLPSGWPRLVATERLVAGHLAMTEGAFDRAVAAYDASLAASRDVEVGFELLTPTYRTLAASRCGIGAEYTSPAPHENPYIRVAWEVLVGRGVADPRAPSSEVRRALRFATSAPRVLRLESKRLVLPDGTAVDLSRRKNVVQVLARLFEARLATPGSVVSPDVLLAAGWPGEKMGAETAQKRLHTAIWTLRSLGLERVLLTKDEGYLLDPAVPVSASEL